MADLIDRVRATGLLEPGRRVLVLLSGGRDSVCLFDIAVRISGAPHVAALHCNYGLRDDAAGDEQHCAALCERLGVELHVHRPRRPAPAGTDPASPAGTGTRPASPAGTDPAAPAGTGTRPASPAGTDPAAPAGTGTRPASPAGTEPASPAGNLQAWARDQRYAAAAGIAVARGGDIAAGHTASDQVETVLYRLAASPGRRALLGMAAREGRLVRPLLGVSRAETAAHCEARGLAWREDASNAAPEFARNRLRAELLPALRSLHPAAEANVLRTLAILRDEAAVLDAIVDQALAEAGDPPALRALGDLPPALRRLALQRLADRAVGGRAPAIGHRTAEVLALAEGGALDVGGGLRAEVRAGALRFGGSRGPAAPHPGYPHT